MKKTIIFITLLLAVVVVVFFIWKQTFTISGYEECVLAGYETLDAKPYDICITPDGVQFMEPLKNPDEYLVQIENIFDERIVYSQAGLNEIPFIRQDCQERGGTLDTCGSGCRDGGVCTKVCRITCEF